MQLSFYSRDGNSTWPGQWAAVVALVCVATRLTGCDTYAQKNVEEREVTLVVSGDTAGWIVPCGCSSGQSGGLLRRASLIQSAAGVGDRLVADVGGAAAGDSDYHRSKFEAILRGEMAMGLVAHNLGQSELAMGVDYLRQIGHRLSVPFVSANATDSDGNAVCQPSVTVQLGGSRYLVIGVVDPSFATDEILVSDPLEAVLRTIQGARAAQLDGFQGMFVLAYCPHERLLEFGSQLPEVDAIIGGPTGQTIAPRKVGGTIVCSATNKGKFLVQIKRDASTRNWHAQIIEVDGSYADDQRQAENLEAFRERLLQADFSANATQVGHFNSIGFLSDDQYCGNESCAKCHARDLEHWLTTKHAIAWTSLQPNRAFADPFCQQCHTTGYAQPNGFQNIASSPSLFNVGCESCHGPSSRHVADPTQRTSFQSRDQCVACHDRENSPRFAYAEYWAKIEHGAKLDREKLNGQDRDSN